MDGIASVLTGLPIRASAVGLMSSDLEGLSTVFEALVAVNTSSVSFPLPFRPSQLLQRKRLCIAIMSHDGYAEPQPAVARAIELVKNSLVASGHEVVPWDPPPHGPAVDNLFKIFGSTCIEEARRAIDASGEPPVALIKSWYDQQDMEASSTTDFWKLCAKLSKYVASYASYLASAGDKTVSGHAIDGIILPVTPSTAVLPGEF